LPEEFRPFVKIGSSVHIPWGNETIIGLVADIAREIPYEGEIKPITGPHCTTPWLSSSEISLLIQLSRKLFVRLHTVAQLFLPLGVFGLFEKENFLQKYLSETLIKLPGAVILPEGVSVKSWSGILP
jgi:primosomal protein N'